MSTGILSLSSRLACFDRDGGLWVLSTGGNLRRLDLDRARLEKRHTLVSPEGVLSIAVRGVGEHLLLVDPGGCELLEEPLASGPRRPLPFEGIVDAAYSPDGSRLLLAHAEEGMLVVDAEDMGVLSAVEYEASGRPVVHVSDDSQRVAVVLPEGVHIHDARSGARLGHLDMTHRGGVRCAAPDPSLASWMIVTASGEALVSAARLDAEHTLFDTERERFRVPLTAITRAPLGAVIAADAEGGLHHVSAEGARTSLASASGAPVRGLALSPGVGAHLVVLREGDRLDVVRLR